MYLYIADPQLPLSQVIPCTLAENAGLDAIHAQYIYRQTHTQIYTYIARYVCMYRDR